MLLKLRFSSKFESHSLRQLSNRSQTCWFRELVTIFERFLLLKIVKSPLHRSIGFKGASWQTAPQRFTSESPLPMAGPPTASLSTSPKVASSLNSQSSVTNPSTTRKGSITSASGRMTGNNSVCWLARTHTLLWTSWPRSSVGCGTGNGGLFPAHLSALNRKPQWPCSRQ